MSLDVMVMLAEASDYVGMGRPRLGLWEIDELPPLRPHYQDAIHFGDFFFCPPKG